MEGTQGKVWWQRLFEWFTEWMRAPAPARIAIAVLLLAALAGAQPFALRVQYADGRAFERRSFGEAKDGLLEHAIVKVSSERVRIRIRNVGRPEYWAGGLQAGDRIALAGVAIGVPPGWVPEWHEQRLFRRLDLVVDGMQVWVCISTEQPWPLPPPANWGRPTDARTFPLGMQFPWLEGGESVWIDCVPEPGDGDGRTLPPRNGAVADAIRAFTGMVEGFDVGARWPRIEKLRRQFTITEASFAPKPARRDLGFLLAQTHLRYAANADGTTRVPGFLGWYHWGVTGDVADGPTNGRYDPGLRALQNYLRTGDPGAWDAAYLLARQKLAAGTVLSDVPVAEVTNRSRYEKGHILSESTPGVRRGGELGKCGTDTPPRHSHQWHAGTLATLLLAGDADALRYTDRIGAALFGLDTKWWARGCRGTAWHLRNLRAYWRLTGQQAFRDEAARVIRRLFSELQPSELHFVDRLGGGDWYPWQEFLLGEELLAWMDGEGVAIEHRGRAVGCIRWALDNGLRVITTASGPALQTAVSLGTVYPTSTNWGAPALTAFTIPVLASAQSWDPSKYRPLYELAVRTVCGGANQLFSDPRFGLDPLSPSETEIEPTGYGAAALKIQCETLHGTEDVYLVPATKS